MAQELVVGPPARREGGKTRLWNRRWAYVSHLSIASLPLLIGLNQGPATAGHQETTACDTSHPVLGHVDGSLSGTKTAGEQSNRIAEVPAAARRISARRDVRLTAIPAIARHAGGAADRQLMWGLWDFYPRAFFFLISARCPQVSGTLSSILFLTQNSGPSVRPY